MKQLLIWHQKWIAVVRHGNSLVNRRVSLGLKIVALFWTKYAICGQIKPGILNLILGRGQSNLSEVFIFVSCEENSCYRVVSVGQLSFDCCSDCGRSRRLQGEYSMAFLFSVDWLYFLWPGINHKYIHSYVLDFLLYFSRVK